MQQKKKQMVTFDGLKNIAEILNQILLSDCHDPVIEIKKNHVNLFFYMTLKFDIRESKSHTSLNERSLHCIKIK